MPELPDIVLLAQSMTDGLASKQVVKTIVNQPKVLYQSVSKFKKNMKDRIFHAFHQRGKWILSILDNEWTLAFNLGMGGELRLHWPPLVPDPNRERVVFSFSDGSQLWAHFWWFGYIHLLKPSELKNHPQIGTLGIEPLSDEFTETKLVSMLEGKRGRIKSYLLDQRFIAGIGNVYIQDILWHARLHPDRKANSLKPIEVKNLHRAIQHVLQEGIRYGPGPGEQDLWGNRGHWGKIVGWPQIAYKTGSHCPTCKTIIEELRIGNTTSYLCPACQV